MYLRWSQVPCRPEDVHPQRNERRVGEGAFWAANEAQGARDVGTTAQSGRQQGCHMGEAHRSAKHTQSVSKSRTSVNALIFLVLSNLPKLLIHYNIRDLLLKST